MVDRGIRGVEVPEEPGQVPRWRRRVRRLVIAGVLATAAIDGAFLGLPVLLSRLDRHLFVPVVAYWNGEPHVFYSEASGHMDWRQVLQLRRGVSPSGPAWRPAALFHAWESGGTWRRERVPAPPGTWRLPWCASRPGSVLFLAGVGGGDAPVRLFEAVPAVHGGFQVSPVSDVVLGRHWWSQAAAATADGSALAMSSHQPGKMTVLLESTGAWREASALGHRYHPQGGGALDIELARDARFPEASAGGAPRRYGSACWLWDLGRGAGDDLIMLGGASGKLLVTAFEGGIWFDTDVHDVTVEDAALVTRDGAHRAVLLTHEDAPATTTLRFGSIEAGKWREMAAWPCETCRELAADVSDEGVEVATAGWRELVLWTIAWDSVPCTSVPLSPEEPYQLGIATTGERVAIVGLVGPEVHLWERTAAGVRHAVVGRGSGFPRARSSRPRS